MYHICEGFIIKYHTSLASDGEFVMLIFFPRPLSQRGIATKCCDPTSPAWPAAASWWLPLLLTHKPRRRRKGEWKVNLPQLFNDRFSSLRQSRGLWSRYFQAALQDDSPRPPPAPRERPGPSQAPPRTQLCTAATFSSSGMAQCSC